ncbi:MAG: alpha/beta fold hydrolase [Hyphomicrobiaceae bacterium]
MQPTLVLLPGLDGTGRLFPRLVHALHGRIETEILAYPFDVSDYPRLTSYLIERLGPGPVILLGESFAGPAAVEIAARRPDVVKALILAVTFVRPPWAPGLLRLAARFDHGLAPVFAVRNMMIGRRHDPALVKLIEELTDTMPRETISARLRAMADIDVADHLRALTCPILSLHGTADWLVPSRSIAAALAGRPNAVVKRLPGPHMLLQCNAQAAADEIVAFVQQLEPAQP